MSTDKPQLPEGAQIERWIYVGRRFDEKEGKVRYYYRRPSEMLSGWTKPIGESYMAKNAAVGALLDVTCIAKPDGGVAAYIKGDHEPRYVGMHGNEDEIVQWAADDRTAYTRQEEVRIVKRDAKRLDAFRDALEPIRVAYWNTPTMRQAAFLATIISYILSPTGRRK